MYNIISNCVSNEIHTVEFIFIAVNHQSISFALVTRPPGTKTFRAWTVRIKGILLCWCLHSKVQRLSRISCRGRGYRSNVYRDSVFSIATLRVATAWAPFHPVKTAPPHALTPGSGEQIETLRQFDVTDQTQSNVKAWSDRPVGCFIHNTDQTQRLIRPVFGTTGVSAIELVSCATAVPETLQDVLWLRVHGVPI